MKVISLDSPVNDIPSLLEISKVATEEEVSNFKVEDVDPQIPGCMTFSSGTTGEAKIVVHTYEGVKKLADAVNFQVDDTSRHIALDYFYTEWSITYSFLINYLLNEATMIFHSKFEPLECFKILDKYKVSYEFSLCKHSISSKVIHLMI